MSLFEIGILVLFLGGAINSIFTLLTLFIIYVVHKNKFNVYLWLMVSLTLGQLIFDVGSMIPFNCQFSSISRQCSAFNQFFFWVGNLAPIAFTNIIVFIATQVVVSRKYFEANLYLPIFVIIVAMPSIGIGIAIAWTFTNHLPQYPVLLHAANSWRLCGILINILCLVIILFYIKVVMAYRNACRDELQPIVVLVKKLSFYPLVQIITKVPSILYNFIYAEPITAFGRVLSPSLSQSTLFFVTVITNPLGGLGNFFIFLWVQQGAYLFFCKMLQSVPQLLGRKDAGSLDAGSDVLSGVKRSVTDRRVNGELTTMEMEMEGERESMFECVLEELDEEELVKMISTAKLARQADDDRI